MYRDSADIFVLILETLGKLYIHTHSHTCRIDVLIDGFREKAMILIYNLKFETSEA